MGSGPEGEKGGGDPIPGTGKSKTQKIERSIRELMRMGESWMENLRQSGKRTSPG